MNQQVNDYNFKYTPSLPEASGKRDKFTFFFGKDNPLSNFRLVNFKHQGVPFHSSEQAVMWRKAKLFGAEGIADQIYKCSTPQEAKKLGRSKQIRFNQQVWDEHKLDIYTHVLRDKFSIPDKALYLINTAHTIIVEASPYDTIWGIGLAENDPRAPYPEDWLGENLLGQALMKVREELIDLHSSNNY